MQLDTGTTPDAKGLMALIETMKLMPYPGRQDRQCISEVDVFLKEGGRYVSHPACKKVGYQMMMLLCTAYCKLLLGCLCYANVCDIPLPSCLCYKVNWGLDAQGNIQYVPCAHAKCVGCVSVPETELFMFMIEHAKVCIMFQV